MAVHNACIVSIPLYGCKTYAKQEQKEDSFHMRRLRRILGISWGDKVLNAQVLARAGLPINYTLLRQRRLRRLGNMCRMEDGRIPMDIF